MTDLRIICTMRVILQNGVWGGGNRNTWRKPRLPALSISVTCREGPESRYEPRATHWSGEKRVFEPLHYRAPPNSVTAAVELYYSWLRACRSMRMSSIQELISQIICLVAQQAATARHKARDWNRHWLALHPIVAKLRGAGRRQEVRHRSYSDWARDRRTHRRMRGTERLKEMTGVRSHVIQNLPHPTLPPVTHPPAMIVSLLAISGLQAYVSRHSSVVDVVKTSSLWASIT